MNPIEFGTELFKTADEIQTKTIKAFEVIAKIDEKLGAMPEQFKIPIICTVTEAVLECENVNNVKSKKTTTSKQTEKNDDWSGAQGNELSSTRLQEERNRGLWGIYG